VTVSLDWAYRGFQVAVLENEHLKATIVPAIGGKLHELIYKPLNRDVLFHHPRVELRQPVFGANVDNWWTGGVDDVLPTGHPCEVDGEELPFLGELWSLPWQIEQEGPHAIRLTRDGVITPFHVERRVELRPDDSSLRLDYMVTNVGTQPFSFIWGLHPGFPIGPKTRIEIAGARAIFAEGDRPGDFRDADEAKWPLASMTRLGPQPTNTWSLFYVTDLHDGRLSITDDEWRVGVSITFPHELFRCVWVWLVDGGWRGIRCVALEPWTGYPGRLDHAIAQGRALTLEPGKTLEAAFAIDVHESADDEKGAER
jgi:galactose mutarotase-like enzyme